MIDNCLPQNIFDDLYKKITDWNYIAWYFTEYTALPSQFKNGKPKKFFEGSWVHNVIVDGTDNSFLAPLAREIVELITEKLNEKVSFLSRVRLGLITKTEESVVHDAHVDFINFPHRTTLLYLNDSDGPTILYNKFHKEGQKFPIECNSNDIVEKIYPKSNRMCSFDGYQYHSSSSPTLNNYRIVMNINYSVK